MTTIPRDSVELVPIVTKKHRMVVDPDTFTMEISVTAPGATRPAEWESAELLDDAVGVMIGPGTQHDYSQLQEAYPYSRRVWSRITVPESQERPVTDCGTFTVT